jgi:ABC-type phosphonate transport system ATPase subunit
LQRFQPVLPTTPESARAEARALAEVPPGGKAGFEVESVALLEGAALASADQPLEQREFDGDNLQSAVPDETLRNVRSALTQSGLPTSSALLVARLASVKTKLDLDTEEAGKIQTAREDLQTCQCDLEIKRNEFLQSWQKLQEPLRGAIFEASCLDTSTCVSDESDTEEVFAPETPTMAVEILPTQREKALQRLEGQNEAGLNQEDNELLGEHGKLERENAQRKQLQQQEREKQGILRKELGVESDMPLETIPARIPELGCVGEQDADGWERALKSATDQCEHNRRERLAEARHHEVEGELLDLEIEKQQYALAEKEIAVKRRSGEIVEKTRQAIVSRVMPLTMQNVGQLLPLLTEGRYSDVKWDEATSTLEVYDTRARDYQRKRIFSGGARDQISLALRLGFALATLPGEHNVRPGWLFLDEPLSSFDRSRTLAMVDLLTKGLIRRQFAQIILISHSESFDPGLFDHRLRMEAGSIVESTLSTH